MKKFQLLSFVAALVSGSAMATTTLANMSELPDISQQASAEGFSGEVGLGFGRYPTFAGSSKTENVSLLPIVNVNYKDSVYFRYNQLGAWFFKTDNGFRFGALVNVQQGRDKDDGIYTVYDRDDSYMAGINAAYKSADFSVEVGALQDVSSKSDGDKQYLQATYNLYQGDDVTLSVFGKIEALSSDIVEYYYNTPESAVNTTMGASVRYKMSEKWNLLAIYSNTNYGKEIENSTIAEDDNTNTFVVGATYSF